MPNAEITDNGGIMNGNDKGIAAIWCRVSTHDQRELSLDSQEIAVRRILEAESYRVPPQYVLKVRLDKPGPNGLSSIPIAPPMDY